MRWLALLLALSCSADAQLRQDHRDRRDRRDDRSSGGPAPLYRTYGPFVPVTTASAPAVGTKPFCVTPTLNAQGDWTDPGTGTTSNSYTLAAFGTFGTANSWMLQRTANDDSGNWLFFFDDGTGTVLQGGANSAAIMLENARTRWSFCVTSAGLTVWKDGTLNATWAGTPTFNLPSGTLYLGQRNDGTAQYTRANEIVSLCIAKGTGLNTGDATKDVQNSCGQFSNSTIPPCYNCVVPAPNAARWYALGDSITASGRQSPRPWPAKLNALLGTAYNITNAGVSGDTVSQMKTRYEATARNWTRCLFLGGVNDINNGSTAATAFATASALLDEMRADGCAPIIIEPTPWAGFSGWTAAKQTQYDSYRSSLSSYASTNGLKYVATTAALGNGSTPASLKTNYTTDGLHPDQVGLDALASTIFATLP